MESDQTPDSGLPGGAVHHLLDASPAHLPSPESSTLSHHPVTCRSSLLPLSHEMCLRERMRCALSTAFCGHMDTFNALEDCLATVCTISSVYRSSVKKDFAMHFLSVIST